jgi:hypothetical protein
VAGRWIQDESIIVHYEFGKSVHNFCRYTGFEPLKCHFDTAAELLRQCKNCEGCDAFQTQME